MVELGSARPRRPALIAAAAGCELEERLRGVEPAATLGARGRICHAGVTGQDAVAACGATRELIDALPPGMPCVTYAPPACFRELVVDGGHASGAAALI